MAVKKTLYEILEVQPSASLEEIKVSHKRLSRNLVSQNVGLSREDIEFQLKVFDIALHTLSNQASRDLYDAEISTPYTPTNVATTYGKNALTVGNVATPITLSAAVEESHEFPLQVVSETVASTVSSVKKIFRIIIGLAVLAFVIKVSTASLTNNLRAHKPARLSEAEEKVMLQEYYLTYGIRPASMEEAHLLDIERRRKENELRASELEERKKDRAYEKFVKESERLGERVSDNLQRAEENARRAAAREARELERKLAREKRELETAERNRIEQDRRDAEAARIAARKRLRMD